LSGGFFFSFFFLHSTLIIAIQFYGESEEPAVKKKAMEGTAEQGGVLMGKSEVVLLSFMLQKLYSEHE
jgi:hypothetical protein